MPNNLICTSDKETADKLIKLGFKVLKSSNGIYTFINDVSSNFEQIDETKIFTTNTLTF
ncbi:MAG: hypothetical protein K0R54_4797 [Clostridiaceae bacterium]|jgi:hypothetical protein|nr:hypothetical protein [Clostridiaceae bacterium]